MCGEYMPNITLSVPEDIHTIMKQHNEIRWSEIARRAISDYAKKLALLDALTQNSELTEEDVMELDEKVKKGIYEHYKRKRSV
jgi:alpha-D-ribose 1-methylphosphonate 5-triphosphate synthase subunit PhnG